MASGMNKSNSKPKTQNPEPQTPNSKLKTLNSKPQTPNTELIRNTMKTIKALLIFLTTFVFAWILPWAWQLATDEPQQYPFAYYSSVANTFGIINFSGEKTIHKDANGNNYTEDQFDSILPMFYFRQLASKGRLPDSLNGREISQKIISINNFYFRYRPRDRFKPHISLYPLFESIPARLDLEMPGDVFSLGDEMTFIDPETNSLLLAKSRQFDENLKKKGFEGPARLVAGSPTTRKAYDEGYFIVDSNNRLFHLKMVNGKPYVGEVVLDDDIVPDWIVTKEYPLRSFYGFLFSRDGRLFTIGTNRYNVEQVPVPEFDVTSDDLLIMGNLFFWNVQVTSDKGKDIYAIDATTREVVDSITFDPGIKDQSDVSEWIFPVKLSFSSYDDNYVMPRFQFVGWHYLVSGFVLMLLYFLIFVRGRKVSFCWALPWIFLTGIYGFLALLVLGRKI
jgi:hypothetical protein